MMPLKRFGKRLVLVAATFIVGACGTAAKSPMDMGQMHHSTPDLAPPPCVMMPTTGNGFLNACTSAQTGDPAKDYPYFPSLAPGGVLPPLQ
jgi:hypothetical protein